MPIKWLKYNLYFTNNLICKDSILNRMSRQELEQIESDLQEHFRILKKEQTTIREKLQYYSDGKNLKGDEIVGWLGEVYCKLLLDGILVSDDKEHDFETKNGDRISVKARKGNEKGWNRTSAIPKIEGDDCPTHLMFVHLEDDYSIDKIWLFSWTELMKTGRFKKHIVRGNHRSYYFQLNPKKDAKFIYYVKSTSSLI